MLRYGLVLVICLVFGVNAREYMKKQPDLFQPCPTKDPDFNNCFKDTLQKILINWKDGIPGLPAVGKLDPLNLKKLKIEENMLIIEMKNILLQGLSTTNITSLSFNIDNHDLKVNVRIPKFRIDGSYKIAGKILFLPLEGHGKLWMEIENITASLSMTSKEVIEDSLKFFNLDSTKSNIKNIDNFRVSFDNLFHGSKELQESTIAVVNQNWRSLLQPLMPTIEETIDSVVMTTFKQMLDFIPMKYFLSEESSEAKTENR